MLLGRPGEHFAERTPIETVNDLDCYLANFWRAVKWAPELVAEHADWPVNEADLHARHRDLVTRVEFRRRMKREAKYFDAEIAGWWVWGLCQWIGSGWCASSNWEDRSRSNGSVEWEGRGAGGARRRRGIQTAEQDVRPNLGSSNGVHQLPQKLPLIGGTRGTGVHRRSRDLSGASEWEKRPRLDSSTGVTMNLSQQLPMISGDSGASGRGIHASALHRKLPMLSGAHGHSGRGVHASGETSGPLIAWMQTLAARLRRVRVCCGDWSRILGRSSTESIGVTGVVLDPPYGGEAGRDPSLYSAEDLTVARDVRRWALANGKNPRLRIVLYGYEGEHKMPKSWECVAWKAAGGYAAAAGNHENAHRERLWFSPHCQLVEKQGDLFSTPPKRVA